MKKAYEKPVINPVRVGLANKMSGKAYAYSRVRDNIDGVPVEELVEKYGSPPLCLLRKEVARAV